MLAMSSLIAAVVPTGHVDSSITKFPARSFGAMLRIAETTNPQSGCLDAVSGVGTVMTNTSAETGTLLARSLPADTTF